MSTRETFAWLLVGFLLGLLFGLWLSNRNTPPNDTEPKAQKPPMATRRNVIDIYGEAAS